MMKTARSVITQIRHNAFQGGDYENVDHFDEFMANPQSFVLIIDYPLTEYGQVFENLELKISPLSRGDICIRIIPGLPSRMMGPKRGVAIAYQRQII